MLDEAEYSDVTVAYGESDSIAFTASEEIAEPEPEPDPVPEKPASIFQKVVNVIKNIFGKLLGWR